MLDPHGQYPSIHGKAHRKAPARVGPPALTRHVGFWMPKGDPGQTFEQRRNAWIANIDWYLMSILVECFFKWKRDEDDATWKAAEKPPQHPWKPMDFMPVSFNVRQMSRKAGSKKPSPPHAYDGYFFKHRGFFSLGGDREETVYRLARFYTVEDELDGNSDRFETVSFRFYFHRIEIKLRAELHTEFFTLSLTASFDMSDEEQAKLKKTDGCSEIRDHFTAIDKVMHERFNDARAIFSRTERRKKARQDVDALGDAGEFLFNGFWKKIEEEITTPAFTPRFKGPSAAHPKDMNLTDQHLGRRFFDFRGVVLSISDENPESVLQPPFAWPNRTSLHEDCEQANFDKSDVFAYIDAVVPLLDSARERLEQLDPAHLEGFRRHGVEYTAAKAQKARALYISSLGNYRTWGKHKEQRDQPVCYVVMTRHKNRWQLGRLIDRLHTAGSFRVASLMDYAALNDAGFELINLESQLNVAFDGSDREEEPGEVVVDKSLQWVAKQHRSRENDWRQLTDSYNDIMRTKGEGGLEYRAERSQFYVQAFRKEVNELRLGRIEGFQIYDAFVERKLGSTWEYISSLSARAARVRRRLDSLGDAIRTKKLSDLQTFAELVGIVPIGYYSGHVLAGVFGHFHVNEWHNYAAPHMPVHDQWVAIGTLMGMAIYSLLVFPRHWHVKNRAAEKPR